MKWWNRKPKAVENRRRSKAAVPVKSPRVWRTRLLRVSALGLVLGLIGAGLWKLNTVMAVRHWQVEAPAAIKPGIQAYFRQKQQYDFWHTRAAVIQRDLLASMPDIRRVEVSRVLPHGLLVKAWARQPVALWVQEGNTVMLVDAQAQVYRALKPNEHLDLPLFRMPAEALPKAVHALQRLATFAPEKVQDLSEVIVEHQDWRLNFAHGEQWQLAQTRLDKDLSRIQDILDKPRWAGGHWRMDARISGRWFIRPAKQEVI